MPIDSLPRHTEKQSPRPNLPTVISKVGNVNEPVTHDPCPRTYRGKRIQSHARDCRLRSGRTRLSETGDRVALQRSGVLFFAPPPPSDGRKLSGEKPSKQEGHPIPRPHKLPPQRFVM